MKDKGEKGKVVPIHAMNAYRGRGVTTPLIPDLGALDRDDWSTSRPIALPSGGKASVQI